MSINRAAPGALVLLLAAIAASPSRAFAQELEPGAYTVSPVGINVLNLSYVFNSGDVNFDGAVNQTDVGRIVRAFGKTTGATWDDGDMDGDGRITVADLATLQYHLPSGIAVDLAAVPEPGTWAMIAAAMVNDLAGWMLLGIASRLALSGSVRLDALALTLAGLAAFAVVAFTLGQRGGVLVRGTTLHAPLEPEVRPRADQ